MTLKYKCRPGGFFEKKKYAELSYVGKPKHLEEWRNDFFQNEEKKGKKSEMELANRHT